MIKSNNSCIEMARIKKGLTIHQLAEKLEIDVTILKGIELGVKFPPLDILKKMCFILEILSDTLLFNETREPLSLHGLSPEQIDTVRYLYRKLKELDEGDYNGYCRQS